MANSSQIVIKNIEELMCILDNDVENNRTVLDQIVSDIAKVNQTFSFSLTDLRRCYIILESYAY